MPMKLRFCDAHKEQTAPSYGISLGELTDVRCGEDDSITGDVHR